MNPKENAADSRMDKKMKIKEGSKKDEQMDSTVTDLQKAHANLAAKKKAVYKKYPHLDPSNDPGTGKPYVFGK